MLDAGYAVTFVPVTGFKSVLQLRLGIPIYVLTKICTLEFTLRFYVLD